MQNDRQLAGSVIPAGSILPVQLYAGERDTVTTQGIVAAGQVLGALNTTGHTYKFPIVALVGGKLVAWNPGAGGANDGDATGTVTFVNAVPVAGDHVDVAGQAFTFAADPDDSGFQVAIGADLPTTAANLAAAIAAADFDEGLIGASAAGAVVTISAPGAAGNAVTLAKTAATAANIVVSGATLTGGDDAGVGSGVADPVGILPHAMDTSVTGTNADTPTSYFEAGAFNFEALAVPDGMTYLEVKAAFARSGITIQQLY